MPSDDAPLPTTPDRRSQRREQVARRILEAAEALFSEHGYEAVTMADLAERAGVSRATVFNYYASKRALIDQLVARMQARLGELIAEELGREASTEQRLQRLFERSARAVKRSSGLARPMLLQAIKVAHAPGEAGQLLRGEHDSYVALVAAGQAQGDVRTDRAAEFLGEMVLSVFSGLWSRWLADERYPLEARARQAAQFIAEAIAA